MMVISWANQREMSSPVETWIRRMIKRRLFLAAARSRHRFARAPRAAQSKPIRGILPGRSAG